MHAYADPALRTHHSTGSLRGTLARVHGAVFAAALCAKVRGGRGGGRAHAGCASLFYRSCTSKTYWKALAPSVTNFSAAHVPPPQAHLRTGLFICGQSFRQALLRRISRVARRGKLHMHAEEDEEEAWQFLTSLKQCSTVGCYSDKCTGPACYKYSFPKWPRPVRRTHLRIFWQNYLRRYRTPLAHRRP